MEFRIADIRPLYGFLDPHGGAAKGAERLRRVASQAAIAIGGMDAIGRIFIVDAWADRCSTDDLIDRMYAVHERWHLKSLGGESNGLAGLFHDAIMRDARLSGRPLPLVKVAQDTHTDKDYRIRQILQPLVGNGRLFIARHLQPLIDQVCAFPLGMQKDLVDAAASLCRFIPPRPHTIRVDREREQLARYLRQRGVNPREIAARCGAPDQEPRTWTDFTASLGRR